MQVTINGFIHALKRQRYSPETGRIEDEIAWEVYPFDMSKASGDRVLLGEQEFIVKLPDDFDIRTGLVQNLEREKKRVAAECQMRLTEIDGQIQQILAIEGHASEAVS